MQPYIFPYIGYFQLINAVDYFVFYDDVNYIKGGWINRNYILLNGDKYLFTISLNHSSSNKLINDLIIIDSFAKFKKTLYQAYSKAPYFKPTIELVEGILDFDDRNLSSFISNSLISLSTYLKINTNFIFSSSLTNDKSKKGQDKVLDICKILNTSTYINAIGGKMLYKKSDFLKNNIELKFISSQNIVYKQFGSKFFPSLSIIDVLMFNSVDIVKNHLMKYELL